MNELTLILMLSTNSVSTINSLKRFYETKKLFPIAPAKLNPL